jgi:hypothetical protein
MSISSFKSPSQGYSNKSKGNSPTNYFDNIRKWAKDDYDNMAKQFPLYDALCGFCKSDHKDKLLASRH